MGSRIKTFDSTGTAPNGRLYAGDLNAMQDQYADQSNLGQTIALATLQVGESGLQLVRYGAGEARITGALRTDGIIRALGGLFAGTFTTTQRNAISSPPYGLIILNTTTNQYEWNAGTPTTPNWQPISPPAGTVSTSGIADGAVTSAKIADGTIAYVDISGALKPSVAAATTDEALRALGTGAGNAAPGSHASQHMGFSAADPTDRISLNSQSGTSYVLASGDQNKIVRLTNAAAITLTIPANSSVAFPVGAAISVMQGGAGQVTITPAAGVTLDATPGLKIAAQSGVATLVKIATDEWLVFGNLTP